MGSAGCAAGGAGAIATSPNGITRPMHSAVSQAVRPGAKAKRELFMSSVLVTRTLRVAGHAPATTSERRVAHDATISLAGALRRRRFGGGLGGWFGRRRGLR